MKLDLDSKDLSQIDLASLTTLILPSLFPHRKQGDSNCFTFLVQAIVKIGEKRNVNPSVNCSTQMHLITVVTCGPLDIKIDTFQV